MWPAIRNGHSMFRERKVKVSVGEMVDKYTILQIKLNHVEHGSIKRDNIMREHAYLKAKVKKLKGIPFGLIDKLRQVNEIIWDLEDHIRQCEANGDFGPDFVATARGIYAMNDYRFKVKQQFNNLFSGKFKEEKILPLYGNG